MHGGCASTDIVRVQIYGRVLVKFTGWDLLCCKAGRDNDRNYGLFRVLNSEHLMKYNYKNITENSEKKRAFASVLGFWSAEIEHLQPLDAVSWALDTPKMHLPPGLDPAEGSFSPRPDLQLDLL